ncbi:MAG: 2-phosphosulfolactate phosphatase family protein [Microcoleaceae cyanobacterium]
MKLFIYHTPELVPSGDAPDCAIAVDVLRATTTMATALNNGAEAVQVFSDINQLMQVSENWPADRRIRIGERGGKKVDGCDEGNSPLALTPEVVKDKRIFISTTNGTRSLERVAEAKAVLAGALINRQAVVNYLLTTQPANICIVGSGWEGSFSLEDTVCAGAIADGLVKESGYPINEIAGNDEVYAAIALYLQWENNLYELLCRSTHGQRLLGLECLDDLKYCSQTDILDVLPKQKEPGVLVKG